tara:strand:- start:177 stop:416 length:240 start_codon:yes stop_codon:yes gene_type:complete
MRHRIDLHGLTHDQAVAKLEAELIGISLGKNWDVEIITGKSKQMQDRIITEVLDTHRFLYYIPVSNPGVIHVTEDALFI